ncbi:MAG: D-glycerate dehydrogenase [Nitrospinota bacterium]|nr:D-glycerate dehydrogenase [Nitrospinota bacterium]
MTRRLPKAAMDRVRKAVNAQVNPHDRPMTRRELLRGLKGKDGVLSLLNDRMDGEAMDAAGPALKVIANYAVGFNNIVVPDATGRGIVVTNTPEVLTETTADMAWSLIMAACRRIAEGDDFLRSGKPWDWAPLMMLGSDVHGKTLGILGLGRIGQGVARRARGFNMKVIYYDAFRQKPAVEKRLGVQYKRFDTVIKQADIITAHTPLMKETIHLINAKVLKAMKKTAYLVNTSRGPIVDEAALARALRRGDIAGAGIDVFEEEPKVHPELVKCRNAVITPHIASATIETRTAMGTLAASNLIAVLKGKKPPTPVNPEVWRKRRK